jgi:hypothetical protein
MPLCCRGPLRSPELRPSRVRRTRADALSPYFRPISTTPTHVELLETLLATLGGASDFEPDRSERTRQAHSLIVKIAEDYAQGSTTVSAEALNWGFWHFGEFSRAYKGCFGELPSDTLRRKPGELQR